MKILVISHTYIAPINREKWKIFARTYPDVQLKVLIPKKWKATLFDIDAGDLSKHNSLNLEFIALDIMHSGNEVLYRYKFGELTKILKKFQPDIIHVEQGDNAFSYFQAILLSKIFCSKAKFTFFTWINWRSKRSWKYKLFWSWIEKINLFFSSGAFVGNEEAKLVLRDKNFKKPIRILFQLGVNENFFYPATKGVDHLCSHPSTGSGRTDLFWKNTVRGELVEPYERYKTNFKLIGCVGRLTKEKGVFLLVDVFEKLANKFVEWNLLFVGNGQAEKELFDYVASKKLDNRVEFRAAVSHEKIGSILNELDILVLPSYDTPEWKEQFGHILIEAMACKVPVVGSSAGQIPHVIGDAGLIFEQKSISELELCLKKLIEYESLRKKIGEKGYLRYKENFSYQVVVDNTHSFWCSL